MKRMISLLCLFGVMLCGCSGKKEPVQVQFFAMDTIMSITAYENGAEDAVRAAVAKVNELESLLSRTRIDSDVTSLHMAAPSAVTVSEDTLQALRLAQEWYEKTDGAFDVTIAPVVAAWGFGGSGDHQVPSPEKLSQWESIETRDITWNAEK